MSYTKNNIITISTVTCGVNPAGMATNGKLLYVANNNNYNIAGQCSVTVINLKTFLPIKTIYHDSFNEPYTVTIKGKKAYVTNSGGSTISIIDMRKNEVCNVIDGFDGPSGMTIVGNIGYVNNYGATPGVGSGNGHSVSIVDLLQQKIIGKINVGLAPAAIIYYKNYVYTINYVDGNPNTGTISKICTKKNTLVDTIGPFSENGLSGPFAIDIIHNKAYITNFGSNNFQPFGSTLSVIDLKKNIVLKTITLGIQPSGIAISKNYAFVSNYNVLYAGSNYTNLTPGSGTINVINLDNYQVISTIKVDQAPSYVIAHPLGRYIYVSNYISNTVNAIRI
jgi:YVTN family beta-propeller protein